MKNKAACVIVSFATLACLIGCSVDGSKSGSSIPSSGTRNEADADEDTKNVSSEVLDLIAVKGKASDAGPGITECTGKDRDKFFRTRHPWGFVPKDPGQLAGAMEHLKGELKKKGWEIKGYERDSSPNKNLTLVADDNKRKFSVEIVYYAKDEPPYLGVTVVSGCYQVPDGQTVEHY